MALRSPGKVAWCSISPVASSNWWRTTWPPPVPRIFPIPLYDPDYYDNGKANGRVATLRVANWIGFFAEYIGTGSDIHGRIIPIGGIRDKTWSGGTADMPKAIRLVQ